MALRRWPKGTYMKLASADTFKALMKQRGMSYRDIGDLADCHFTFVGQLARGERDSCSAELGERIARSLGVPSEVLFVARASAVSGSDNKPVRTKGKAA